LVNYIIVDAERTIATLAYVTPRANRWFVFGWKVPHYATLEVVAENDVCLG